MATSQRALNSVNAAGEKEFAELQLSVDASGNVVSGGSGLTQSQATAAIDNSTLVLGTFSNTGDILSAISGLQIAIGAIGDASDIASPTGNIVQVLKAIASGSTTAATLTDGGKVPAAVGTPEAISTSLLVSSVDIQAIRPTRSANAVATANTGNVYIGFSSTNDGQKWQLTPGQTLTLKAPQGKKINLNNIYVDAVTQGDGIAFLAVS